MSSTETERFWAEQGKIIDWIKPYTKVKNTSFDSPVSIKWYEDGTLNACYNCVDRHLPDKANHTALIWEGDNPGDSASITFQELHTNVCRFANVLKARGVGKGDRVVIYMPMILDAVYAMLACARIGAIHCVVFGGFSPESLAKRIQDCDAKMVITANEGVRGGKLIPLKTNVDEALQSASVDTVLVVQRTDADTFMQDDRDVWYHEAVKTVANDCPCEEMSAEDPLFILYTSGSTGTPKGVLHTTGGYMVYAALTMQTVFDTKPDDVYWCTADVGWITGHSYLVYGPLANGITSLVFEGVPTYPDASRCWQVVDKHQVTLFYTAPTAIRALMCHGEEPLKSTSRRTLRCLGTVGEPINPEAWQWYHKQVGNGQCYIVDTWWQTETGGILLTPLPETHPNPKPGYASAPLFNIAACILDKDGNILEGEAEGNLCFADSWPGQMRGVYGDHQRFEDTYFKDFPGYYFSGDGCKREADSTYRITGRVDDVINVSGHRLGTAEIEAAINQVDVVAESAVIGFPHDIKGEGIYAYVILKTCGDAEAESPADIEQQLKQSVRKSIGAIAVPDVVHVCPALPKTRSGKIMRRILRKIAASKGNLEVDQLGDISTLAEPEVVAQLLRNIPLSNSK